jgi:hypothetical protein
MPLAQSVISIRDVFASIQNCPKFFLDSSKIPSKMQNVQNSITLSKSPSPFQNSTKEKPTES